MIGGALLRFLVGLLATLAGAIPAPASAAKPKSAPSAPIERVFIVVLENEDYDSTFGESTQIPYLAKTLPAKGALLTRYYGVGHASLGNYLALISGQALNPQTQADCPLFTDFAPGTPAPLGQLVGSGCVYPAGTLTVANQLERADLTWKGYMEDMGSSCRHPEIGAPDETEAARIGDQYATRHNPFVYFHSIIDSPTCIRNNVDYSRFAGDIRSKARTPNYAFITPNLCNDGHDEPCVDGQTGGMTQADGWLRDNIPPILRSPGFRDNGLLIVTFDEAESGDATACCNEQPGPNLDAPGRTGPGGGRVGAVMLSPCIRPGTVSNVPYNHYSLLRSVEDFFGLRYLGHAKQPGLKSLGRDVFGKHPEGSSSLGRCRAARRR